MTNYTNDDLYQMLLHRLRKDKKGSVNAEEFETFLRWRNIDHFNKQFQFEGASKLNHESLRPFIQYHDVTAVVQEAATETYYVDLTTPSLSFAFAHEINAWWSTSSIVWSTLIEVDLVSHAEHNARLNNAITSPTATNPIGYIDSTKLRLSGVTTGYILLDYYKYPNDPYFDYYTDASGNITYISAAISPYTLQTGEIARDGSVAPTAVTTSSVELEWGDQDAINILDMIVSDVSIALSDPESFQASLLERKENVSS